MLTWHITKEYGHPWDQKPGWDLLEARATTQVELDAFIAKAAKKFWKPWIVGNCDDPSNGAFGCALYKPSGIMEDWVDPGPDAEFVPKGKPAEKKNSETKSECVQSNE